MTKNTMTIEQTLLLKLNDEHQINWAEKHDANLDAYHLISFVSIGDSLFDPYFTPIGMNSSKFRHFLYSTSCDFKL